MTRNDIRSLIAKGKLSDALTALSAALPAGMENDIIALQSRLSILEREERMGMLSFSDASVRRNQITSSALQLVEEIPENGTSAGNTTQIHAGSGDNVAGNKIVNINNGGTPDTPPSNVKSILFSAANPSDQARIQTDVEYRTIREEMQKGNKRSDFQFLPVQLAVRITELMRAFKDKPTIVHFAGHGEQEGILISNDQNESLVLNDATLQRLFKPLIGATELILLNSCYSAFQAEMISKFGITVIGHNMPIGDPAAVSFAKGFYLGLSEGMSYEDAFNDGFTAVLAENGQFAHVIEVWKDGEKLAW